MVPSLSSLSDYEVLNKCGEGTYGCVFKARHRESQQLVALKKVANVPKEEGSPVEVKYLLQLVTQKNIINLRDFFWTSGDTEKSPMQLCLIFEYMDYDLWRLMTGPSVAFTSIQIKCLMKQLLEGLHQCHSSGIMHRDIKPSNLLINSQGVLKLADFGLTTSCKTNTYLSNNVVSLYYRSPELLLGSHYYGPEIDMWSVGCILVELITHNYLFAGSNEAEQLDLIFRVFGTPTEALWPGVTKLPDWEKKVQNNPKYPTRDLSSLFNFLEPDAYNLVVRLLTLDPEKRITSSEALQHPWFGSSPLPCAPHRLPSNWTGTTRDVVKKYQLDFVRSRDLCADILAFLPPAPKKPTATRGRPRGSTTRKAPSTRASRAAPYSPSRCKRTSKAAAAAVAAAAGACRQFPIVIAS